MPRNANWKKTAPCISSGLTDGKKCPLIEKRWSIILLREHDKGPEEFFHTLFGLMDSGAEFKVSVVGEQFSEIPGI
jgi:hypothetical protein